MVNMAIPYRGPDGMSAQLFAEVRSRFGARAQNLGYVTGYPEAARRGETGGHFPDRHGITHAVDIGVDVQADGTGLRTQDALWLAHHLRALGAVGKHPFSQRGYLIHDMSETTTPRPLIAGAHTGWKWQHYGGASPHSDHIHVTTGGDQQWGETPQLQPAVYNSHHSWGIEKGEPVADTGWARRPVPEMYRETQRFKDDATIYNYGKGHGAVDYGTPMNTPVIAPEDGVVEHADWVWNLPGGAYDWTVRDYQIKPAFGDTRTGGGIALKLRNPIGSRWWHCHLQRTDLNPGDRVRKGDIIGYTGNTGSSTGPHLHLSLLPPNPAWGNGYFGAIDPLPFIREKYLPNTYTAWQGAPTKGVGATTKPKPKTVLEEIMALDRGSAEYKAVVNDIAKAVLETRVEHTGTLPDGTKLKGTTSLKQMLSWDTWRGYRQRRIEAGIEDISDAVRPSTLIAVLNPTTPKIEEN